MIAWPSYSFDIRDFPRHLSELLDSLVFAAEDSGLSPLHRSDARVAAPQILGTLFVSLGRGTQRLEIDVLEL